MHRIAISWFAWELTGSAFWVGMVAFCDLAPAVVVSPIAGAIADRTDRLKLTFWSQAMIGVMAAVIALLVALDKLDIYTLLLLEVLNGIASSFAQPARQSLMPGLVPRSDLTAAVGLNSLCFNVARFVGPALAGPLIASEHLRIRTGDLIRYIRATTRFWGLADPLPMAVIDPPYRVASKGGEMA